MHSMECERLKRQLQLKEEAVRELKAINDTYKSKCEYLEAEIGRSFDQVKAFQAEIDDKNR